MRHRHIHLRIERLTVEQRGENTATKAPQPQRVIEQVRQRPILQATGGGQIDRRQELRLRGGEGGIGGKQLPLGLNNIRTAVQQRGGQLGRQRERRQSAEILALNAARVAARQDAQGVLLLSYLMLKRRDLRTG